MEEQSSFFSDNKYYTVAEANELVCKVCSTQNGVSLCCEYCHYTICIACQLKRFYAGDYSCAHCQKDNKQWHQYTSVRNYHSFYKKHWTRKSVMEAFALWPEIRYQDEAGVFHEQFPLPTLLEGPEHATENTRLLHQYQSLSSQHTAKVASDMCEFKRHLANFCYDDDTYFSEFREFSQKHRARINIPFTTQISLAIFIMEKKKAGEQACKSLDQYHRLLMVEASERVSTSPF